MRLLGRHIFGRAAYADGATRASPDEGHRRMREIRARATDGQTEIGDARETRYRCDEDVLGFEIAMKHVAQMRFMNATRDLHDPARDLVDVARPQRRHRGTERDLALLRVILAD